MLKSSLFSRVGIGISLCLSFFLLPAHAQQAQTPPADVLQAPGLIIDWNRREPATHTEREPDAEPAPEPEVNMEQAQPETGDPNLHKPFPVDEIRVEGISRVSRSKIEAIVREYEGRELNFIQIQELAERLTQLYRDEGFVTTQVYIPPQRLENRTVVLQAAEGVVGEVHYEPEPWWPARGVLPRISMESGDPFNVEPLKRQLRRINDNPDFKLRATLEPGAESGQTNLILEGQGQNPIHVTLFYDNLGRPVIGRQRWGVTTQHNNLLGLGDRVYNSLSWTRESFGTVTHYEVPVGPHGTRLNFDHAYSTLELGKPYDNLDVDGRAQIYSGYLSQELLNEDYGRISADLGFDFKNVATDIRGRRFSRDRIRMLRPALNFDFFDPYGRTMMRHEVGIGLNWFDATDESDSISRRGADSKFVRYTGSLTRIQRMPWRTYAIWRVMGQTANDLLPSVEQFQLGGAFTVRGYLEGELIGDAGWLTSLEYRMPAFIFPASWHVPKTQYTLRDNINFVTFVDYGALWVKNPAIGLRGRNQLLGWGVGLRANLTRFLAARVDMGVPVLTDDVPDRQPVRLHFGLESRLF